MYDFGPQFKLIGCMLVLAGIATGLFIAVVLYWFVQWLKIAL